MPLHSHYPVLHNANFRPYSNTTAHARQWKRDKSSQTLIIISCPAFSVHRALFQPRIQKTHTLQPRKKTISPQKNTQPTFQKHQQHPGLASARARSLPLSKLDHRARSRHRKTTLALLLQQQEKRRIESKESRKE